MIFKSSRSLILVSAIALPLAIPACGQPVTEASNGIEVELSDASNGVRTGELNEVVFDDTETGYTVTLTEVNLGALETDHLELGKIGNTLLEDADGEFEISVAVQVKNGSDHEAKFGVTNAEVNEKPIGLQAVQPTKVPPGETVNVEIYLAAPSGFDVSDTKNIKFDAKLTNMDDDDTASTTVRLSLE